MRSVVSDYLEAIYALQAEGEAAFAVTLAEMFAVSRANASATVQRMVRDGLVEVAGRQISLTVRGRAEAESGLRRHRLTERFLIDVLGMDWATVHEQARSFERGLSPLLEERIDERLGRPRTCPHGNPVPRADLDAASYLRSQRAIRLSEAPPGEQRVLLSISELARDRADLLRFCAAHGLRPGVPVTVLETAEDGLLVRAARETTAIARGLATRIWTIEKRE